MDKQQISPNQGPRYGHRVNWSDGMLLQPEHFYQQESFLLGVCAEWMRKLCTNFVGISAMEIDRGGLSRGYFSLKVISGIFPDNTHFDFPERGSLPTPVSITPKNEGDIFAIAIKTNTSSMGKNNETAISAQINEMRYEFIDTTIAKQDSLLEQEMVLQLAYLRTRLCRINEVGLDEVAIPIAKIEKVSDGNVVELDEKYIPPMLDLRASPWLWNELNSLVDLIEHRLNWQSSRISQPQTSSMLEVSDFLMLRALSQSRANLRLLLAQHPASPIEVYQALLILSSEFLALQHPQKQTDDLVIWTPATSAAAYHQILANLKGYLSVMRERIAIEVNFHATSNNTLATSIPLPNFNLNSRLILAVHAEVPNNWFWSRFHTHAIICPLERLPDHVRLQLPGIPHKHLSTTPPELPIQTGWHYYELEAGGELWHNLVRSQSLGIHISGDWPGIEVRGWVLQNSSANRVKR